MDVKTLEDIEQMDKHYVNASPECKEAYSRRIERGPLAQAFKKVTGFKCQMCERLGQNPYPFKKRDGEYYVEPTISSPFPSFRREVWPPAT